MHTTIHHGTDGWFTCHHCKKSYPNKDLINHSKSHKTPGRQNMSGRLYKKYFRIKSGFTRHNNIKFNPFKCCQICYRSFFSKLAFNHVCRNCRRTRYKMVGQDGSTEPIDVTVSKYNISNTVVDVDISRQTDAIQHHDTNTILQQDQHISEYSANNTVIDKDLCRQTDAAHYRNMDTTFQQDHHMSQNLKTIIGKDITLPGKILDNGQSTSLNGKQTKNTRGSLFKCSKPGPFKCTLCKKLYKKKIYLSVHMRLYHMETCNIQNNSRITNDTLLPDTISEKQISICLDMAQISHIDGNLHFQSKKCSNFVIFI